jgi:uncharacterized protein with NRDE domain
VCTLIALHQVHRDYPLVVAANRDEFYARRSSPPLRLRESPRVVGGRDEEKGGTWLGVSERGLFVGITNQRTPAPPDASLRSRGEVVYGALAAPDLSHALDALAALDGRDYNSFNLMLGDAQRLYVAYARRELERLEIVALAPGIWALPNDRLGSLDFPKADRASELARDLVDLPWPELVPRAQTMLADHQGELLQALCVHTPSYGTRSSSLLAIGPRGVAHYLHAEGPPCESTLRDCTDLLINKPGPLS